MTMTRTVLLRLSENGEPCNNESIQNGVLILPALKPLPGDKAGDAVFNLRFQIDAGSAVTSNGVFYTNVPKDITQQFNRTSFRAFPIEPTFHRDTTIVVPIYSTGPFAYYITYKVDGKEKRTDVFYFTVPPQLNWKGRYLAFNAISMQTFVSKFAGPLKDWDNLFGYIARKGYNMIHFTPLQHRGHSDSPYSIYDQLNFDPTLFESNSSAEKFLHEKLKANNLLSLTDVVFNHTASDSAWIREHPDSGYNAETAPHLRSAIELDEALLDFSNKLGELGLPTELTSEQDLDVIMGGIQTQVLDKLQLWQYYVFDKVSIVEEVRAYNREKIHSTKIPCSVDLNDLRSVSNYVLLVANENDSIVFADRYANKINTAKFISVLIAIVGNSSDALVSKASDIIDEINVDLYKTYDNDIASIKSQTKSRIRYLRLDGNGPKLGPITKENLLVECYFTTFEDKSGKKWSLANNGWIWAGNPLIDFASNQSKAYIRREVIVWGDCIKLRYGKSAQDSPYLWQRMIEYSEMCAKFFDGFRLDNCHSTPLHVGEALLDAARSVNPNLYVVAELFTGSEAMDQIFVERLGINSLIREAMLAWNVDELSRLVHKHGGRPIGSLAWLPLDEFAYPADKEPQANLYVESNSELEIPKVLSPQVPHALFLDCSHDNQTPNQIRTVEDTLPTAALVSFCSSAIGSVFGFDETYPSLLDIVQETRQYAYDESSGIAIAMAKLNLCRESLSAESDDSYQDQEMYVHHEGQYITIQRYNTISGEGLFLIARAKFEQFSGAQVLLPVELKGTEVKAEFAYVLKKTGEFHDDEHKLCGIPTQLRELNATVIDFNGSDSVIRVTDAFEPGSIAVFSTRIPTANAALDKYVKEGAIEATLDLSLYDLNALLYRCEPEERDASGGRDGVYDIPNYGALTYAGLEGWVSVLKDVIWRNDLGHAMCSHLRDGLWAADYIVNRLDKYSSESKGMCRFRDWLKSRVSAIREVPNFLRPHYFALIIGVSYEASRFRVLRLMASHIQTGTNFVQSLALTSVQMCGYMNNTSLIPTEKVPTLAAGLPHFCNDYMRCWGRDVFISLRGLFLVPGRFDDARRHILSFAKTLKHGLIPNLLDAGRNPRFNSRDAVWFFAQAVQEYVIQAPNGESILEEQVLRRFPLDDTWIPWEDDRVFNYQSSIRDILYEILSRHAKGISYREANAGPNLDSQMTDDGFNIRIYVDWDTGLVHGGSKNNCGTWMDKMGESAKAGNKGVPGTPRDGSNVELQGLLKSTLRFVNALHSKGLFCYTEVEKPNGTKISLKQWEQLVQDNFEKCFYIPANSADDFKYIIDSSLVNRRGIYKDIHGCGEPYQDYQLRANFPIAMCVAPELFTPDKATKAIQVADQVIRGSVGMRTLDPSDWSYRPYYCNSEESDDFATSKGRNYHQGPEWVWCFGFFIRAFLHFKVEGSLKSRSEVLQQISSRLVAHRKWIRESPWAGLTELTNKDGAFCNDSSPTQAWSTSCLLDLYYDVWNKA